MSTETLSRHREEMPEDEPDIIVLEQEPQTATYGLYRPARRVLGSMAASAAAGEFLRDTEAFIASSAPPDAPAKDRRNEDSLDDAFMSAA